MRPRKSENNVLLKSGRKTKLSDHINIKYITQTLGIKNLNKNLKRGKREILVNNAPNRGL
jgi:hypothetical protein